MSQPAQGRRRPIRLLAFVGLGLLGITALLYERTWTPFMDDGPFHGRVRANCSTLGTPSQAFPLGGGMQLETHVGELGKASPTVLLRRADGGIQWCVFADGRSPADVSTVHFTDTRRRIGGGVTVRGEVEWTFGDETTWWQLEMNGDLKGYWYSW